MNKTPEMLEGTHKRWTDPDTHDFCFEHGVQYDPAYMCTECEIEIFDPNDIMWKIIEAAYHCALHMHEIHEMIKNNGLPESSDETIHNLLGLYTEEVKKGHEEYQRKRQLEAR